MVYWEWVWYTGSGCGILGVGVVYCEWVWYTGVSVVHWVWVWYTVSGCGTLGVGVVHWVWVWYTGCGCHSRYCAPMQTLNELEVLLKTHEEEAQRKAYEVRMELEGSLHACQGS